mgnify:CR=1 FL=1
MIRTPNNVCGLEDPDSVRTSTGNIVGENEFRNNIVFNGQDAFFDDFNGRGNKWTNIAGNVFIRGPSTKTRLNSNIPHGIYAIDAWDFESRAAMSGVADLQDMCLQDNIGIGLPTVTAPTTAMTRFCAASPLTPRSSETSATGNAPPSMDNRNVPHATAGLGDSFFRSIGLHPRDPPGGDLDQDHAAIGHRHRAFGKAQAFGYQFHPESFPLPL